jgi:23S rRNA pseudouridine1911/1915/1917 synthase
MLPDVDILFEEGPCLAVNKPSGLLTQAPPEIDSLEARVKRFLVLRDHKPGRAYLGVPHRLDRPVSGVLVLAKHVRAARRLCEQFENRTVEKVYWALVEGRVTEPSGVWVDHIRKVPDEARAEVLDPQHPDGREARLTYRVLDQGSFGTWLEIQLETGRMHQIRLQSATRGHPVLGDELYGSHVPFGPPAGDPRQRGIALHARRLSFRHPMTRALVLITAPLSSAWRELGISES